MGVEESKPRPAPPVEPVARDDVKVSVSRCPYCHDSVEPVASTVCNQCLARHHATCWDESGVCASCGSDQSLSPTQAPATPARGGELPPRVVRFLRTPQAPLTTLTLAVLPLICVVTLYPRVLASPGSALEHLFYVGVLTLGIAGTLLNGVRSRTAGLAVMHSAMTAMPAAMVAAAVAMRSDYTGRLELAQTWWVGGCLLTALAVFLGWLRRERFESDEDEPEA